ncbi:unnamed protein product, partial [Symbiodinium pilosum]
VARIRVYEGSWKTSPSGELQPRERRGDVEAALDVATVEGHVWAKMPGKVKKALQAEGSMMAPLVR